MRYAIVMERAGSNLRGYVPGLPGRMATGATIEETEQELLAAIGFHLDGLREDGIAPPKGESIVEYVLVPQPWNADGCAANGYARSRSTAALQRWPQTKPCNCPPCFAQAAICRRAVASQPASTSMVAPETR